MLPVLPYRAGHQPWLRLTPLMAALGMVLSPLITPAATAAPQAMHSRPAAMQTFRFQQDHVLGTSLDIVLTARSALEAERAVQAIQQEIARLDRILSAWRDDSEMSQLNREHLIKASPELIEVIAACEAWRTATCGAFDARLGMLIDAWQQGNGVHQLGDITRQQLLSQLSQSSISLNARTGVVRTSTAIKLAPDGYAKGYVIDRALAAARAAVPTLQGLLLDIGGDVRVWGQSPQQDGWHIGVRDAGIRADNILPSQVVRLTHQAIAFSGQGARDMAGQAHLLNPATGLPVNQVEQCVVVGKCAADADALATALAAMPPQQGLALIDALLGYEAQLVDTRGNVFQSRGWHNLLSHPPAQQPRSGNPPGWLNVGSTAKSSWPAGYQARLELTIPKINVENYRAPYVAVWVTDSSKKLVRTLAIWGKDKKWLDSNYTWWRRYGRQMDNLDTVARPSRQPGQYSLVWDGKDDQGQLVGAGKYIVHVEFSREHGEHTYQTLELDVRTPGGSQNVPARAEMGALRLHFQRGI